MERSILRASLINLVCNRLKCFRIKGSPVLKLYLQASQQAIVEKSIFTAIEKLHSVSSCEKLLHLMFAKSQILFRLYSLDCVDELQLTCPSIHMQI